MRFITSLLCALALSAPVMLTMADSAQACCKGKKCNKKSGKCGNKECAKKDCKGDCDHHKSEGSVTKDAAPAAAKDAKPSH